MATIEEKLAFKKAREMTEQEAKAFVKGISDDVLLDEIRRRYAILRGFAKEVRVQDILFNEE